MVSGSPRSAAFLAPGLSILGSRLATGTRFTKRHTSEQAKIMPDNVPINLRDACMAGRELLQAEEGRVPRWAKLRRTHCEQMFSALPLRADIAQCSRHVRFVPQHKVAALQPAALGQEPRCRKPAER